MLELEDAREYQQWKETYVDPVVNKTLTDPTQSDPAQLRASQNLGRGIQADEARDVVAQGISGAGFDIGGTRHQAADEDIANSVESLNLATLGATHEAVKQQGISNTGSLINTGRQVYKQQGII
jgi:kynurenine formamidase